MAKTENFSPSLNLVLTNESFSNIMQRKKEVLHGLQSKDNKEVTDRKKDLIKEGNKQKEIA